MPGNIRLVEESLRNELVLIGVDPVVASISELDKSGDSFVVTIVSRAFEGQAYLDREMRVRPAVARAFSCHGMLRSAFVVEVQTPEEESDDQAEATGEFFVGEDVAPEERLTRQRWREQCASVIRALKGTNYEIEEVLDRRVLLATRKQLAVEKVLVGFAPSVNSSTVDLETRRTMERTSQVQRISASYYLSPSELANPWANQSKLTWLQLQTASDFLHTLAASQAVANELRASADNCLRPAQGEQAWPVIEPSVRLQDGRVLSQGLFRFIEDWASRDKTSFLVLMAPAGHGKTTMSLELARRFCEEFGDNRPGRKVPLLVPFESVRRTVDFEAIVYKTLAERNGGSFAAFGELLRLNHAMLIVDGFDELADDAGQGVAEAQVRSMRSLLQGSAKIVLAGRTMFTQHFAGGVPIADRVRSLLGEIDVEVVEILPFDEERIAKFIRTRSNVDPAAQERVLAFSGVSPDHQEVCANPLFLRLLCSLAASDQLPAVSQVDIGIKSIVEGVCKREETRQNLGLGVPGQLEFLGWIAAEIFRLGAAWLPRCDAEAIAASVAEARQAPDIVGRLLDHALLAQARLGGVAFIHPVVRDVILGDSICAQLAAIGAAKQSSLGQRDIPEGTVNHLAQDGFAPDRLPAGWLSNPAHTSSHVRRNLFRICIAYARLRNPNPRQWLVPEWVHDGRIVALDVSGLTLESLLLDGLILQACDFSNAIIDDCDLSGAKFVQCALEGTIFSSCWADSSLEVLESSRVRDCEVLTDATVRRASSPRELGAHLMENAVAGSASSDAAARACVELIRRVLAELVEFDPVRFHSKLRDSLAATGRDAAERLALERAIFPALLNKICEVRLSAGSRENLELAKHWRKPVVDYLKNNHRTPGFQALVAKAVARGVKHFS